MRAGDGVVNLWPDVEWERRHFAQVWYSDHQIAAEKPGCNYQGTKSGHGRALPCRFCSWAHGRRRTRGGGAVEHEEAISTNLSSPHGTKETELAVLVRPAPDSRKSPQEEYSNSTTVRRKKKISEIRATREAQRPRCGVGDLWSAVIDLRTRLSSLWRGLQGVAGGSVSNPHVMGCGGFL